MTTRSAALLSIALIAGAALDAASGTEPLVRLGTEASLRPDPGASALSALLTSGTEVTVLEERDGWSRVRLEGWVPSDAIRRDVAPTPAPVAPSPVASPAPVVLPPAAATTSGSVAGSLRYRTGALKKARGAGESILLVPAAVDLDQGGGGGEEELERLEALEAEALELEAAAARAMAGSNFADAMAEADRIKAKRRVVLSERDDILAARHGRHEAVARQAAIATAVADAKGRFVFPPVPPGGYVVYSRLRTDDLDLEWVREIEVGSAPVQVELDESDAR